MDFGIHAKVDEDKGSPLQNGANYLRLYYCGRGRKIESSAEALRVVPPPVHLSLHKKIAVLQTLRVTAGAKGSGWHIVWVEPAGVG